ncbi:MAG: 4-hydroxythreonine-4-phosphate dehydrogenase PdxA [Bacteroidetes bacterium]|nr:4-hydroxythreonine-4-phosphate dehydrogenase PdxA [Bacteroidota bacterium]
MEPTQEKEKRIRVGITHGDMNGISYEIIIKTLQDQRLLENYTIIVYGSSKIASYYRKTLNIADFNFNVIHKAEQAHPHRPNILNIHDEEVKIDIGQSTAIAGELALLSLEAACADLARHEIDVVVTAPINKKNIQSDAFRYPGHSEYFAHKFDSPDHLMLMVSREIRIGMVTGHVALNRVREVLTEDLIIRKINIMNHSLIRDLGIVKPRIAVLALNPHAGDDGLIGDEDSTFIRSAISTCYNQNILVFGPYPADGFFGAAQFTHFDGILAMYHDQGMIPFKLLSFDEGVNFTAGLPVIRTSPGHGTAYEIAGKNVASTEGFRTAVHLACDIFENRQKYDELVANPLKPADPPKDNG